MGNEMIRNMAVQAKSGGLLAVEQFLQDNYLFRRNVLNGKVEYVTLPVEGEPQYREMTPEALMSIIIRARKELADEKCNPKTDIQDLLRSEEVRAYDPIREFLESLPQWDGQNHVARLFSRLPGLSTEQHHFLAIWLRSAVAHWLQMAQIFYGSQKTRKAQKERIIIATAPLAQANYSKLFQFLSSNFFLILLCRFLSTVQHEIKKTNKKELFAYR